MKSKVHRSSALTLVVCCAASLFIPTLCFGLGDGRHFEMVSPLYKGGYGVNVMSAVASIGSQEGDGVVFGSLGAFANTPGSGLLNLYIARREASSWVTLPNMVPASLLPNGFTNDWSPDLERELSYGAEASNSGLAELYPGRAGFWIHDPNSEDAAQLFEFVGLPLERVDKKPLTTFGGGNGSSAGFCHVLLFSNARIPLLPEAVAPEAENSEFLYDEATGAPGCGTPQRWLRLVGESNQHRLLSPCSMWLGSTTFDKANAIAASGDEIFFSMSLSPAHGECETARYPPVLMARLGGERTIDISTPIQADCAATAPCASAASKLASFVGADEAGTRVFFVTTQPLVTDDTDNSSDLYMARIGCRLPGTSCAASEREVTSLVLVSHGINAVEAAEVQGTALVSTDGRRAYFVARGILANEPNGEGASPTAGAENLYVYDSENGTTKFIADLCSGPEQSGAANDVRCPAGLAANDERAAKNDARLWLGELGQATATGSYLVFASYAQLASSDTDTGRDVYRYDAESGRLDRISTGENGYSADGNGEGFDAQVPAYTPNGSLMLNDELDYRAISEDGSRIVFESSEPLSPLAVNGVINAYEWHKEEGWEEGRVSLVSNGSDPEAVGRSRGEVTITPSGRDIFFMTAEGLVRQDTDGAVDIYDARLGVGFPTESTSPEPCEGDGCQGPLTEPLPLLAPESASSTAEPDRSKPRSTRLHIRRHRPKARRPHRRRGVRRHGAKGGAIMRGRR